MGCTQSASVYSEITVRNFFQQGTTKWDRGDYDGALREFDDAIQENPDDAAAFTNRAVVKIKHGDLKGAIADCDEALRIDPKCTKTFNNRAYAWLEMGSLEAAKRDAEQSLDLDPEYVQPYGTRALVREREGDVNAAIEDWNQVLKRVACPNSYASRGRLRKAIGDLHGAATDFERADQCSSGSFALAKLVVQLEASLQDDEVLATGCSLAGSQLFRLVLPSRSSVKQAALKMAVEMERPSSSVAFVLPNGTQLHEYSCESSFAEVIGIM